MSKDVLSVMRGRLQVASGALSESREDELDDLRFYAGSPDNQWQWPQDVLGTRTTTSGQSAAARPCLTINKLPQHVRQITNDQRQNRPAGKVIPVDDKADKEVAEVFDGMVRHIEYISDADVADDTACEAQVTFGEGYFRLLTEYCDDESFDQDIRIGRIRNSFSVYMDPMIQDPCGADAEWCFICEDIPRDEYEREWPDAQLASSLQQQGIGDSGASAWVSEKTIRIAEYFWATYEKVKLFDFGDGQPVFEDDERGKQFAAAKIKPRQTRTVSRRKIKWAKTNGFELLEERDWLGKWIPVIRVVGNEYEVEGKIYLSGIVRNAKDAQRMYNYWTSQEAEMLALAPKAPFIGYAGQFEGYEHQWKTANTTNWPYLEVNPDVTDHDGKVLPRPERAAPPMPQAGLIQAKMGASDDIKSTTGQYDASLGAEANEKSGRAILARERQTDTGTYHYVDNLARAVRLRTRMIVDLIPKVYNSKRIARIIGMDGDTDYAHLDPDQPEPVRKIQDEQTGAVIGKIYNPSVGKYDVCVTTGPSYMTKRQEAVESMTALLKQAPQLMQVAGDLMIQNMDWPGAEEIAARVKRTIDPKLLDEGEDTPEMAAAKQQIQQLGQNLEQMHGALQAMAHSIEAQEQDRENYKAGIEAYKAETDRMQALAPAITPEQVQMLVMQTMQEILSTPMPEPPQYDDGPPMAEMIEQQPPEGGFFAPDGFGAQPNEGMQP